MSAPLGTQQAHDLRCAEARWLQSARDRLRRRPGGADQRRTPTARTTPDQTQESR
jgi:hypothetical protein